MCSSCPPTVGGECERAGRERKEVKTQCTGSFSGNTCQHFRTLVGAATETLLDRRAGPTSQCCSTVGSVTFPKRAWARAPFPASTPESGCTAWHQRAHTPPVPCRPALFCLSPRSPGLTGKQAVPWRLSQARLMEAPCGPWLSVCLQTLLPGGLLPPCTSGFQTWPLGASFPVGLPKTLQPRSVHQPTSCPCDSRALSEPRPSSWFLN